MSQGTLSMKAGKLQLLQVVFIIIIIGASIDFINSTLLILGVFEAVKELEIEVSEVSIKSAANLYLCNITLKISNPTDYKSLRLDYAKCRLYLMHEERWIQVGMNDKLFPENFYLHPRILHKITIQIKISEWLTYVDVNLKNANAIWKVSYELWIYSDLGLNYISNSLIIMTRELNLINAISTSYCS